MNFSFKIGGTYYPTVDSFHIYDTLNFIIDVPISLQDLNSNQIISYSGAENLGTVISFQKLGATNQFSIDAVEKFSLIVSQGLETHRTPLDVVYRFIEVNSRYQFLLKIIPRETGIYSLIVGNAANVNRKNFPCEKSYFNINILNTDRHPNLYPSYTGGPYPEGGDYFFKVVQ